MENVLDRGFSKVKGTEKKGRSKKKVRVVRAQKRESVR